MSYNDYLDEDDDELFRRADELLQDTDKWEEWVVDEVVFVRVPEPDRPISTDFDINTSGTKVIIDLQVSIALLTNSLVSSWSILIGSGLFTNNNIPRLETKKNDFIYA